MSDHVHPCNICGDSMPCDGDLERNYDGEPSVICSAFHLPLGVTAPGFICDDCRDSGDREPPEPDGEAFRGGEAAAYEREQIAARLK
jgi:hypothetical protein